MNTLKWALVAWTMFIAVGAGVFWTISRAFPQHLWIAVIGELVFLGWMGSLIPATFEDVGLALGGHFKMPRLSMFFLSMAHVLFQIPCWRQTTSSLAALGAAKMQMLFGDLDEAEKWSKKAETLVHQDNWRCQFKAKLIAGMIAFRRARYGDSIELLSEAIAIHDKHVGSLTFAALVAELQEHKVTALDFLALARLSQQDGAGAITACELSATIRDTTSPKYAECYRHYWQALLHFAKHDRAGALENICAAAEAVPEGPMKPFDEYVVLNILQMLRSLECDDAMHEYHLLETRVITHLHGFGRATWLDDFQLLSLIDGSEWVDESQLLSLLERQAKVDVSTP